MASEYGNSNLPVVIKTTTTVAVGVKTRIVETLHASGSVPAITIGSVSGGLKVIEVQTEPYGGGITKQIVTSQGSDSESTPSIPATTYECQGSIQEVDIGQHPNWETTFKSHWDNDKEAFKPDSPYFRIFSYIVGSCTVTKTEYFSSQPSDRYADIGTLEVPGGGYSGTNKWLIIGTSRRKVSEGLYARETQYLYSAKGYNTDIYS